MRSKFFALVAALVFILAAAPRASAGSIHVDVTATPTLVLDTNQPAGGRHRLLIQNSGANAMYCRWGAAVVADHGFILRTGEAWSETAIQLANGKWILIPSDPIYCDTTAGAAIANVWVW